MEHKLEVIYIGAAAIFFAAAVMGFIKVEQTFTDSLVALEQQTNEGRVVIRTGGR